MKSAFSRWTLARSRQEPSAPRLLDRLPSHLLTAMIFAIPITTAGSNILAGLLLLAWLARGSFRADWRELRANQVALVALAFFALHVVGLAWSADLAHGLAATQKEWKFLLLPVFLFCARRDHAHHYVSALLAAMALCVVLSFCIRLGVVEPWGRATIDNPVPFGTHVVYGPLLAISIYLAAERLLFRFRGDLSRLALAVLLGAMVVNLFVTAGRAGHVMFLAAVALLGFQFVWASRKATERADATGPDVTLALPKAAMVALGVGIAAFFVAYAASGPFRAGLAESLEDARNYRVDPASPVGERLAYGAAGLEVFHAHPFLGVGTGDLPTEMNAVLTRDDVDIRRRGNPHSMYVMVMGRFGAVGLVTLLGLFATQLRVALARRPDDDGDTLGRIGVALPALYALICLAESYLAIHATALLFAALSGFLYKHGASPAESGGSMRAKEAEQGPGRQGLASRSVREAGLARPCGRVGSSLRELLGLRARIRSHLRLGAGTVLRRRLLAPLRGALAVFASAKTAKGSTQPFSNSTVFYGAGLHGRTPPAMGELPALPCASAVGDASPAEGSLHGRTPPATGELPALPCASAVGDASPAEGSLHGRTPPATGELPALPCASAVGDASPAEGSLHGRTPPATGELPALPCASAVGDASPAEGSLHGSTPPAMRELPALPCASAVGDASPAEGSLHGSTPPAMRELPALPCASAVGDASPAEGS